MKRCSQSDESIRPTLTDQGSDFMCCELFLLSGAPQLHKNGIKESSAAVEKKHTKLDDNRRSKQNENSYISSSPACCFYLMSSVVWWGGVFRKEGCMHSQVLGRWWGLCRQRLNGGWIINQRELWRAWSWATSWFEKVSFPPVNDSDFYLLIHS